MIIHEENKNPKKDPIYFFFKQRIYSPILGIH